MTSIQLSTDTYFAEAEKKTAVSQDLKNPFTIPKIEKICINVGVGRLDNAQKNLVAELMEKFTGQKPKKVKTKKSIAAFKVRKGDVVGIVLTLRGRKAKDFLLNLVYLALPRTRDFRGLKLAAFSSDYTTYSLGIENASIFPAIGFDTEVSFGMQVNIVFKQGHPNNKVFLENLNFPFQKTSVKI